VFLETGLVGSTGPEQGEQQRRDRETKEANAHDNLVSNGGRARLVGPPRDGI
jgi:hypothetical protein